jgi:hypothetical protein
MRLDEIVTLNDVLKANQYVKLLHALSTKAGNDINITRIKNRVIQSWKKGMKHRKHYDDLLSKIDISLNDLIDK